MRTLPLLAARAVRDQQDPLALQENQVWMETMEKMAKMVGMEETHSYYQLCPANHV